MQRYRDRLGRRDLRAGTAAGDNKAQAREFQSERNQALHNYFLHLVALKCHRGNPLPQRRRASVPDRLQQRPWDSVRRAISLPVSTDAYTDTLYGVGVIRVDGGVPRPA